MTDRTRDLTVFGVYGPKATEKIASVCSASAPEAALSLARGSIREAGVTVARDDGVTGEEGYLVVVENAGAGTVFDAMVNRGLNAAPMGYETWDDLTLGAGTPLFDIDFQDADPAAVGAANAYPDGELPEASARPLRAFSTEAVPEAGAAVRTGDGSVVGRVTRAGETSAGDAIGFAFLSAGLDEPLLIGPDEISASVAELPFVGGSDQSARIPAFA